MLSQALVTLSKTLAYFSSVAMAPKARASNSETPTCPLFQDLLDQLKPSTNQKHIGKPMF